MRDAGLKAVLAGWILHALQVEIVGADGYRRGQVVRSCERQCQFRGLLEQLHLIVVVRAESIAMVLDVALPVDVALRARRTQYGVGEDGGAAPVGVGGSGTCWGCGCARIVSFERAPRFGRPAIQDQQ